MSQRIAKTKSIIIEFENGKKEKFEGAGVFKCLRATAIGSTDPHFSITLMMRAPGGVGNHGTPVVDDVLEKIDETLDET